MTVDAPLSSALRIIAGMIAPSSHVLDIGCSRGHLLTWLKHHKDVSGRGIEIDNNKVQEAIAQGLSVVQGDVEDDLHYYAEDMYDYIVLNQILQTMHDPVSTLEQAGKVAKYVIVSVPNFGHWRNRCYLMFRGKMPVTSQLDYEWYETPNIHFCTLRDFSLFCDMMGFTIRKRVILTSMWLPKWLSKRMMISNFWGEKGVFLLERTH